VDNLKHVKKKKNTRIRKKVRGAAAPSSEKELAEGKRKGRGEKKDGVLGLEEGRQAEE